MELDQQSIDQYIGKIGDMSGERGNTDSQYNDATF